MADKQYSWLSAETAERLLRGESLDNAVEPADRDEAERLAKTLGALSADPPSSTELPGEAAALAAFRKARADRGTAPLATAPGTRANGPRASASHGADPHPADAGLVRIGVPGHRAPRSRRGRSVRLGLAAALAFGMAGGVAVAAGTGVLPFGDDEPAPHASVSAAAPSDRPLSSPSPENGIESEPTPDGSASGSDPDGSHGDAGGTGSTAPGTGKNARPGGYGTWWNGAPSACRDMRDGKRLSTEQRRDLEEHAGGSTHVWRYCKDILAYPNAGTGAGMGGATGGQSGQTGRQDSDNDDDNDRDDHGGRGGRGGQGGDDEGHHRGPGGHGNDHHQNGGFTPVSPTPPPGSSDTAALQPRRAETSPAPSPSPSYSAL
ncbi:hypothetical protein [Streptomyces sp. S.PB5]|uniref:hypothetical protein n=1 Tax=Streptomyces sp. S.PB5 TaxID=3020844 RepID=UPI0025AED7C2|nr:hypothetical protein [Streptomyces sp. S.PB5]MDN3024449.1 hypothetical protein [Streptomyces sp. S.PB5]